MFVVVVGGIEISRLESDLTNVWREGELRREGRIEGGKEGGLLHHVRHGLMD